MKRWYVVQVFAGYEEAVQADLKKSIERQSLDDYFGEVLVPAAKMKQFFSSTDALKDQQLFPGYILIEMEPGETAAQRLVTKTPRVIKFLGGRDPVPLPKREVDRILAQMRGEVAITDKVHAFIVGKEVDINEGPFAGFVGIIENVNEESEKMTVMVSIFGRMTPVELGFDQVKQ